MERNHEAPEIPLRQLGGIDQRNSPLEVGASNFNFLQGLYPKKNGLLARLPGKSILQRFDEPVLSIHATGDRDNHILVQTRTRLYMFTLAELLGEDTQTISLEDDPSVIVDNSDDPRYEDYADLAILAYTAADGGTPVYLSSSWGDLPISHTALNESVVSSVTTGAAGTFTLAAGTYSIDAYLNLFVTNAANDTGSASTIRLYDVTNTQTVSKVSANTLGEGATSYHKVSHHVELTSSTVFKLQGKAVSGSTTYYPTNAGMSENNTSILIKIHKYN